MYRLPIVLAITGLRLPASTNASFATASGFLYTSGRTCLDAIGAQEVEDRLTNSTRHGLRRRYYAE
jgi:hypothetical protein